MQLSFYAIDDTSVNYGMVDQPIPPQRLDFAVIYTSQLLTPYGSVSIVPYVSGNVNVEGLPGAAPGGAAPLFYGAETGVTPSSGVFDYVDGTFFPNPYNTDGSFPGAPGMSGGPALQDSAAGLLQDVGVDSLDGDAVELTSGDLATIQDWEAGTPRRSRRLPPTRRRSTRSSAALRSPTPQPMSRRNSTRSMPTRTSTRLR